MDITADELLNMFDTSIGQIGSGEGICKFLEILSRNPKLEFMDAINIYTQYPDGKMLDTYRGWDKNHGRHIKRWEKGIKSVDYIQEELLDDEGETYDIVLIPKLITKYDISQTQGKSVEMFSNKRNIDNEKCQLKFRILLEGVIKEQLKWLGLPLNSLAGVCSKYIILKFYGVTDKDFDRHRERFFFKQNESVNYFLGELFEVLERVYDKLVNGYLNIINEFISTEPDVEIISECVENKKISFDEEAQVAVSIQPSERVQDISTVTVEKTEINKDMHKTDILDTEKVQEQKRESLLKRLKIKTAEAKILNSERDI